MARILAAGALLAAGAPAWAGDGCLQQTFEDGPLPLPGCRVAGDGRLLLDAAALDALAYDADGNAVVIAGAGFHYVKRDGRQLHVLTWDNDADRFQEGRVRARIDGRVGYFDHDFRPAFAARFDFGWPFEDGIALVCDGCRPGDGDGDGHVPMVGGRWFHIDRAGRQRDAARDGPF